MPGRWPAVRPAIAFFDEITMDEIYHKRWRPADVRKLSELYAAGRSPEEIAGELGRNVRAVKSKVWRLGLRRKQIAREARRNLDCMPNPFGWMK